MLFTCLIINLVVVVTSNPFHKYPYVFLLDLGNEEIQNTVSEQIRVSVPGGSFALKYPAVPGTDIISHVRVSGIDFGTDLKANIADGGPGYNYVVLVFMGNPGVTYDAVITIDIAEGGKETSEDDENDSAEDLEDKLDSGVAKTYSEKTSEDAMIASSDVYKYGNKVIDTNYKDYEQSEDSDIDTLEENDDESNADENTDDDDDDDRQSMEQNIENESPEDKAHLNNLLKSKYVSYESFKPRLYGGVRIYPQAGLYVDDTDSRPVYDPENHENDEQVYERSNSNFRDSNNNIKLDYNSVME